MLEAVSPNMDVVPTSAGGEGGERETPSSPLSVKLCTPFPKLYGDAAATDAEAAVAFDRGGERRPKSCLSVMLGGVSPKPGAVCATAAAICEGSDGVGIDSSICATLWMPAQNVGAAAAAAGVPVVSGFTSSSPLVEMTTPWSISEALRGYIGVQCKEATVDVTIYVRPGLTASGGTMNRVYNCTASGRRLDVSLLELYFEK